MFHAGRLQKHVYATNSDLFYFGKMDFFVEKKLNTTQRPQWGSYQGPLDLESVALPISLDNGFCKILRK